MAGKVLLSRFHCSADSLKEETRSVSPHCPKPDESEEPLGTAIETGAAAGEVRFWCRAAKEAETDGQFIRNRAPCHMLIN